MNLYFCTGLALGLDAALDLAVVLDLVHAGDHTPVADLAPVPARTAKVHGVIPVPDPNLEESPIASLVPDPSEVVRLFFKFSLIVKL